MTCTETLSTLTPKHHLLYPDVMCHRIAVAICEQFEKNELLLKLLNMIPYIRKFQKGDLGFVPDTRTSNIYVMVLSTPLLRKSTSCKMYLKMDICKILASQCNPCKYLATLCYLCKDLGSLCNSCKILQESCKKSIVWKNLTRNTFFQDTYKILHNSAKIMHYLARFCKNLARNMFFLN